MRSTRVSRDRCRPQRPDWRPRPPSAAGSAAWGAVASMLGVSQAFAWGSLAVAVTLLTGAWCIMAYRVVTLLASVMPVLLERFRDSARGTAIVVTLIPTLEALESPNRP